jgi:hypothetical protein
MKKFNVILTIIIAIGTFSGCNLDYNEVSMFTEEWMFENEAEVNGMLGVVYGHVPHGFVDPNVFAYSDGAMLASATDESDYSYSLSYIHRYYNGAWSSINAFPSTWHNSYWAIYQANDFLEKLDKVFATLEAYEHNEDTGPRPYIHMLEVFEMYPYQARFLRAFFLFELAKTYGDVPLVTRTLTPAEANQLTRTPVQEVFQFIVDECDAIAESLPISYAAVRGNHIGRVNRPTVLALKARTLLYAASSLFEPEGRTAEQRKEAWRKAAVASKELIDHAENWGIKLAPYANLWAVNNFSAVSEVIWFRHWGGTFLMAEYNYPVGNEHARGGNCPSQNLVDAYEYSKAAPAGRQGKSFAAVNPSDIAADAYEHLDPRFALTVAKNGDTWPLVAPYNAYPLETFEGGRNGSPIVNATTTGYYLKKLVNGNNRLVNPISTSLYTWVTYRLGEFYLNYAEAMFNYMDRNATAAGAGTLNMSANDAINVLRNRSGINMPLFGNETNGDVWEERYMRERMVELAFEGHRFWDVRRWKKGEDYFTKIKTVRVTRDGTVTRGPEISRGEWNNKYYLHPIPFGELQKAQGLTQNSGWSD